VKRWIQAFLFAGLFLALASTASAQAGYAQGIAWRYTPAGAFPAGGATITVCTALAIGQPCAPTISLFADSLLSFPVTNPLPQCTMQPQTGCMDNLGNFSFYSTAGQYTYTVTGAGLASYGPMPILSTILSAGSLTGTVAANQIAYGCGVNTICSSSNLGWNAGTLVMSMVNPTAATNVLNQNSPAIQLTGNIWNGAASVQDTWTLQNVVGTTGFQVVQLSHSGGIPAQPTTFNVPAQLSLGVANSGLTSSEINFFGVNSGGFHIEAAASAGSPTAVAWPTGDPPVNGAVLEGILGSPVQMAWVAQLKNCGQTSGATQLCAQTGVGPTQIIFGDVQLNTATTQSITGLLFNSSTSYACTGSDLTTTTGSVFFNTYAAASVTIGENGGANTDHLRYICVGN
jgi:hypothetical protein